MRFEKWQALGNDYLIVEEQELPFELTPERVRRLCRAHFGVAADGVLLLSRPRDASHVAELRIFNPDGSEAELSGNGARQAILYLRRRGWTDRDSFAVGTPAGSIRPQITGPGTCRIDMGRARLSSPDYPGGNPDGLGELTPGPGADPIRFRHVSIGNPQCAIRVRDTRALAGLDLGVLGPAIEAHPAFPNRTNVSWYAELAKWRTARIRARIFERGAGETLSSGTGACGAAIAYLLDRAATSSAAGAGPRGSVRVVLDGGELDVEVGEELSVHLTGWALPVFAGRLSEEILHELTENG
jgi:diaminopimelate epimerase